VWRVGCLVDEAMGRNEGIEPVQAGERNCARFLDSVVFVRTRCDPATLRKKKRLPVLEWLDRLGEKFTRS